MLEYKANTRISAPTGAIWEILVDTARYCEWDPATDRIEGEVGPGAKIKAYSKLSPGRGFKLKVTAFEPGARMVWRGGMPFGLFRGERTFTLADRGDGTVDFSMCEVFSGPMLGLIRKSLPDMTEAFDGFARALKERAEQRAAS